VLREVFLNADVGISGVNFGVAETGTLCLVTNEGNGRMVTTLPQGPHRTDGHGAPRPKPRRPGADALAPAALGHRTKAERIHPDHSRAPFDPDQERHIILIDNGRSGLRNSPLKESLYCIRCGACLNACPVFREIGGHAYDSVYPGPIGSVISAGLFGSEFVPLAQASSLCGACKEACPVDIDLPKLLTRVRAGQTAMKDGMRKDTGLSSMSKLFLKTYSRLATRPRLFALSQKFAALGTFLLSPFNDHVRLPTFTGWGYSKDLPRFAKKPFRERFHREDARNAKVIFQESKEEHGDTVIPKIQKDKVEQFIEELTGVSGQVIRTRADEVTKQVIEFLQSRNINHIHLEPNVLDEAVLQQAGIAVSREFDAAIRVGVTKAVCGLADSGSILEADGEGDKLYASLLPEVHLAILHESDIHPSLEHAMPLTRETKSAVFITGPSRTGDIEMSHTIGVHGPGEVVVFLAA
jgi:L-lactate utilization protein LutB